jgi:HTH-type transcriptional regulator/antitoxin HigA
MGTREDIRSDLAIPPGEYLAEVLDELGMSQADLARRMGRPAQAINEIIKGTKALTPETALQLEQVVGVPAHIWLGLEAEYRLVSAQQIDNEQVKKETRFLTSFPYREMVQLGCVAPVRKAEEKVRELRRFFGVASLEQLDQVPAYAPAFRLGGGERKPSSYGLAAWLHCGLQEVKNTEVAPFDKAKLAALVPSLRELTSTGADQVAGELRTRLGNCGVVFTLFPHFPGIYAHGATFWIEPKRKAVLLSSVRGRWADIFWFSLFHELGHLLLHGNVVFIESTKDTVPLPEEKEADVFARDKLISPAEYEAFVAAGDFSQMAVAGFATEVGIHSGIVVGRLQHEKLVPQNRLNHLRMRYRLATEEPAA